MDLAKKLKKMGFTISEVEEKVGDTISNIFHSSIIHAVRGWKGNPGRLAKTFFPKGREYKLEDVLIAGKSDLITLPYAFYGLMENVDIFRHVYHVSAGIELKTYEGGFLKRERGIFEEPAVETNFKPGEDVPVLGTRAYIPINRRGIAGAEIYHPTQLIFKLFELAGVNYVNKLDSLKEE